MTPWLLISIGILQAAPFAAGAWLVRHQGRSIVGRFQAQYGNELLLLSGCGFVYRYNVCRA